LPFLLLELKKMNYKLNLFKSTFDLNQTHQDKTTFDALWNSPDVVSHLHRDAAGRELFLLHDGPPYANGNLHLGHFVNKTLKDAVLKFKRLEGHFAPFVPGFDCHGLPVELEVEKLGFNKKNPVAFVEACRSYAVGQVANQTAEFRSFGVAADWEHAYRTLDPEFEAGSAELFASLPFVEKRLRPVHWCPDCASSLAESEVDYKQRAGESVVVLFPVEGLDGTFLKVWTTTPYTLPANKAVAFNPTLDYVRVTEGGRQLVRARNENDPVDTESFDLSGRTALSPYTRLSVPVLAADYVTSAGTGLVHLAPAFGMDDFRVGEKYGLAVEHYVDERGKFLNGALAGLTLKQASEAVKAGLGALLYSSDTVEHDYPHCWRHKKPVFFKASEEWFMDLSQTGDDALRALDPVTFVPDSGRERLSGMLRTRTSWCLSRNRLWGTPLVDPENPEEVGLLEKVRSSGVEAWQSGHPRRTLDVWFDSGVTHELVLRRRFGRSADVYLEGSDQHRGWFQSSLLTSVAMGRAAPFRTVVTHGFVVDEHGRKYSKSSGNYMPLADMFRKYSPDVLRLWTLQQDFTTELKLSPQSLALTVDRYRKLRNTLRFCLQNTSDYDANVCVELLNPMNRLQVVKLRRLVTDVSDAASAFDFGRGVAHLVEYAEEVSSGYFTAVKDALYCDAPDSPVRREVQFVLAKLLETFTRLLMPLLPFTAEEAFQAAKQAMGWTEETSLLLTLGDLRLPEVGDAAELSTAFAELSKLKREAHRFAESARDQGVKSVAQVDLVVTLPPGLDWLSTATLSEYFGCARLTTDEGGDFAVRMSVTENCACPRCRRYVVPEFVVLCERCAKEDVMYEVSNVAVE
jgi:isoleucyl-tRNA synthetase